MAKFGIDQVNNPAPLTYKRIVNFIIMCQPPVVALLGTLNAQKVIDDKSLAITMAVLLCVSGILKTVQQFLGATPPQEVVDTETGQQVPAK